MKNTLKRIGGVFYANGKDFPTFREALNFIYKKNKERKNVL